LNTSEKNGKALNEKVKNRSVKKLIIRRGDIYYADLSPVVGSEQGGIRPVLIIQNNVGNRHSPTVICAAITSKMNKAKLPTHIELSTKDYQIVKNSVILLEQIRTIDKQRLKEFVCHIDSGKMKKVEEAIRVSLELPT
jgi:mRNA interferase MazF